MNSTNTTVNSGDSSVLVLEENLSRVTKYTRWIFKILGVWPMVSKNSATIDWIYSYFLICLNFSLLASVAIPFGIYIVWLEKDINKKLISMGPFGFTITCALKYLSILFHANRIKQCFEYVEICWSFVGSNDELGMMIRSTNFSQKLTMICAIFMYSGGISHVIYDTFLVGKETNSSNETIKNFIVPGYDFFFNIQAFPLYEVLYIITFTGALSSYTLVVAACNLAALLESHMLGVNQILKARLKELVQINNKNGKHSLDERIAFIIKCHVFIIKFGENIERVLREICLVEVVISTLLICLLEYYCLMVIKKLKH